MDGTIGFPLCLHRRTGTRKWTKNEWGDSQGTDPLESRVREIKGWQQEEMVGKGELRIPPICC